MGKINRGDIKMDEFQEIFKRESHHAHEIIIDKYGEYRWVKNQIVADLVEKISLNDLCQLLMELGYNKNSEVYRKLYRDMGYSLFGYWEIFYWDVNNEYADDYRIRGIAKLKNNIARCFERIYSKFKRK